MLEVVDFFYFLFDKFGNMDFKLVVFMIDEIFYLCEIVFLFGWYCSFYIGVFWWFIDVFELVMRFKYVVIEMVGFSWVSGMIDDICVFCLILVCYDMSWCFDVVYFVELVVLGRFDLDEVVEIVYWLIVE